MREQAMTFKQRGNALLAAGQLDQAAECYREALLIDPSYAEGYVNLGYVLREQRRFDDAKRNREQAVMLNPQSADAFYMLGAIAHEQGHLDRAIEHYGRALELQPDFKPARRELCIACNNLGTILQAQGELSEAA